MKQEAKPEFDYEAALRDAQADHLRLPDESWEAAHTRLTELLARLIEQKTAGASAAGADAHAASAAAASSAVAGAGARTAEAAAAPATETAAAVKVEPAPTEEAAAPAGTVNADPAEAAAAPAEAAAAPAEEAAPDDELPYPILEQQVDLPPPEDREEMLHRLFNLLDQAAGCTDDLRTDEGALRLFIEAYEKGERSRSSWG